MVPVSRTIPRNIVADHVRRLADLLRAENLAAMIVFDPSNMLAFTGTPHAAWDRLTCGVVTTDGEVMVICPAFELPAVSGASGFATIHTWREHEDAYALLQKGITAAGIRGGRVGLDGRTWIDERERFAAALPGITLIGAEHLLREVRICKTPAEVELARAIHRKGELLFLAAQSVLRVGAKEIDVYDQLVAELAAKKVSANPMVQSGPNASVPHNPTGARAIQRDDLIVIDSVVVGDGYMNDLTRTYCLGEPSAEARRAYETVREAQRAAIAAARPGVECRAVDRAAREVIDRAGFGDFFTHRVGHGIGIECHEPPYLNGANTEKLRPGMMMTIEPGIYVPGQYGVRIEDDIVITDRGCDVIRGELMTDVSPAFGG